MKKTKIKTNQLSCCKHCQFYHGNNKIVCAVHPYGPDSNTCSNFTPKVEDSGHSATPKTHTDASFFGDCNGWIKVLVISLFLSFSGYSFALWRLIKYSPNTPNTKVESFTNKDANKLSKPKILNSLPQ